MPIRVTIRTSHSKARTALKGRALPLVSVVIPVYNAATHLRQCIDSLLAQTLTDFEVICVDDGSTDDSLEILAEYASQDGRLRVVSQHNKGAGAARNAGIEVACGEYLSFLDADDFFEPRMLEAAYQQCHADDADVGVYRSRYYDMRKDQFFSAEGLLRFDMLPQKRPFSYRDMPEHVFVFSSPAPWSKLYRRGFVMDSELRFQEIRRSNDFFFTKAAFVKAERITVIDEVLVNYRIGGETNLQSGNHETPLEFYESLLALRDELVRMGILDELKVGFINTAVSNCLYNLNSIKEPGPFLELYERLRDEMAQELGLLDLEREDFFVTRQHDQLLVLLLRGPEQYLLGEVLHANGQCAVKRHQLKQISRQVKKEKSRLKRLRGSRAYKVSRRIQRLAGRLRLRSSSAKGRV